MLFSLVEQDSTFSVLKGKFSGLILYRTQWRRSHSNEWVRLVLFHLLYFLMKSIRFEMKTVKRTCLLYNCLLNIFKRILSKSFVATLLTEFRWFSLLALARSQFAKQKIWQFFSPLSLMRHTNTSGSSIESWSCFDHVLEHAISESWENAVKRDCIL